MIALPPQWARGRPHGVWNLIKQTGSNPISYPDPPYWTSPGGAWGALLAASTGYGDYVCGTGIAGGELFVSVEKQIVVDDDHPDGEEVTTIAYLPGYYQKATYKFAFFSANCKLKLNWDEVQTTQDGSNAPVVTTLNSREFIWTPDAGNPCKKDGFYVPQGQPDYDPSTDTTDPPLYFTPEFELVPTQPTITPPDVPEPPPDGSASSSATITIQVQNIRWSCIDGYDAPLDGTANGYPLPYAGDFGRPSYPESYS
jgi:hypothetical protein